MAVNEPDDLQNTESQIVIHEVRDSNIDVVSSPTLARLIEEVRNDEEFREQAYNRMHNRHNRSR